MAILDIFHDDAFSIVNLSIRMNDLPYVPGQISGSGLFDTSGIDTLFVGVEMRENSLALVGVSPRGGPGETIALGEDKMKLFPVPHYQRDDALRADEVQGRREFGTDSEVETVLGRIARKAQRHYWDFDMTLEHQRMGALKGIVVAKGGGVLLNCYTEFQKAPPAPVSFDLDVGATLVRTKCREIVYRMEDASELPYSGIDAWCGRDFYAKLIDHKSIRETYLNTAQAAELRGDPDPDSFEVGGITFRRYKTGIKATAANANSPYIGANECRFVFRGIPDMFITRFAPADYLETVNTTGLPRYAKQWATNDDKGVNLQFQMNPISICTRPDLLFSAYTTSADIPA